MNLTNNDLGALTMLLLFGGPVLGWIVYSVASSWRAVRIAEQNAVLKQQMLDRGMSPEQIATVMGGDRSEPSTPDVTKTMIENGYEADDLKAVATAVDQLPATIRHEAIRSAVAMAENGYDGADIAKFLESRTGAVNGERFTPARV